LGRGFASSADDAVQEIVEAIGRERSEDRIDFVCIANRGMILPTRQEDGVTTMSAPYDGAPMEMFISGQSSELTPAFFLAYLVDVLENISLERLRLWKYLIPQTSSSSPPSSRPATTDPSSSPHAPESIASGS
jgi:hypothetical protein